MEASRCGGEPVWRRAAQTIIKKFYNRNFSILIFFSAARMSVCAAAPSPCLPPPKRFPAESAGVNRATGKRFGGKAFRRESVSAGKAFRRESVSAGKRFGVSSARCGAIGVGCAVRRADRRIGGLPDPPIR